MIFSTITLKKKQREIITRVKSVEMREVIVSLQTLIKKKNDYQIKDLSRFSSQLKEFLPTNERQ